MSDHLHATARGPMRIGGGNSFALTNLKIVLRDRPVMAHTSGSIRRRYSLMSKVAISVAPDGDFPFWRQRPAGSQPAPLSRGRFQFQPTDPGDRSVLAATPGGLPTCSAAPRPTPCAA